MVAGLAKAQNHSSPVHRFPIFPASLCSTTFSGGAALPAPPPGELAPSSNPHPNAEMGWADSGMGAGPRRVFPQRALLLFWNRLMQMRTVPGRPVFSLGSGSLKAEGMEGVVASA